MYLDPLAKMLERAQAQNAGRDEWTGIFPSAPKQSLMLMMDVKNKPEETYSALLEIFEPFIAKGWLTFYDGEKIHPGPVTIIGTGDTPLRLVLAASPRYIFFDAPLLTLDKELIVDGKPVDWGPHISPMASGKWLWSSYYPNIPALKRYSDEAHKRGIKARWWGVARWPGPLRRALWSLQLQAGVDWLNADDLAE